MSSRFEGEHPDITWSKEDLIAYAKEAFDWELSPALRKKEMVKALTQQTELIQKARSHFARRGG